MNPCAFSSYALPVTSSATRDSGSCLFSLINQSSHSLGPPINPFITRTRFYAFNPNHAEHAYNQATMLFAAVKPAHESAPPRRQDPIGCFWEPVGASQRLCRPSFVPILRIIVGASKPASKFDYPPQCGQPPLLARHLGRLEKPEVMRKFCHSFRKCSFSGLFRVDRL